jgi:hypothetical protein
MQYKRLLAGLCAGATLWVAAGCAVDADGEPGSTTVIHDKDNPSTVPVPVPGPSTHTETNTTTPAAPGTPSTSTTTTTGG